MSFTTVSLTVVSAHECIYQGKAKSLQITGSEGELGVMPGHAPLLTALKPGMALITQEDDSQEVLYLSGGTLEVQPNQVIVLADIVCRANEINEKAAKEAKERAKIHMHTSHSDIDYASAAAELSRAIAQLRVIQVSKKRLNK